MTKSPFKYYADDSYGEIAGSRIFSREYTGESPNGNPFNGMWVLRAGDGAFIDFDRYRLDLAGRHDIELLSQFALEIRELEARREMLCEAFAEQLLTHDDFTDRLRPITLKLRQYGVDT